MCATFVSLGKKNSGCGDTFIYFDALAVLQ
jgi:hypothetical protein